GVLAERVGKLPQVIVEQEGKMIADRGKSRVVRFGRVGHRQMVNGTGCLQQRLCQMRIVESADGKPAFDHRGHRRKSLRLPAGANNQVQPPAAGASYWV